MSHVYTADASNFNANVTLPDDGDPEVVASVNTPFEDLADSVAYLQGRGLLKTDVFLAAGTWTCPDTVTKVVVTGFGGGGGGGGAGAGSGSADTWRGSGAGGGGSIKTTHVVTVVPGLVYSVAIGAGGAASSAGATNGGNGGDTTFSSPTPTILATCEGAGFGAANTSVTSANDAAFSRCGGPFSHPNGSSSTSCVATAFLSGGVTPLLSNFNPMQGWGAGFGAAGATRTSGAVLAAGWKSPEGYVGGSSGSVGTDDGSYRGGCGGGGGAAGPGGVGGNGGNGGNANSAGTGGAANSGTAAAANTGAGGGGSGSAGAGSGGGGAAAASGAGGSGWLAVSYVGKQAVVT